MNKKVYIGQSGHMLGRWTEHKSELNGGIHYNPHLQNAWKKYGEQSLAL